MGKRDTNRKQGRRNIEKRRGVLEIERRTAWLWRPLVAWSGVARKVQNPPGSAFRTVEEVLQEALANHHEGLYAIELRWGGAKESVNPSAGEVVNLTARVIAETLSAMRAARRYPRMLPPRLGDLEAWRREAEAQLQGASAALRNPPQVEQGVLRIDFSPPTTGGVAVSEYLWAAREDRLAEFQAALRVLTGHPAWDTRLAGLAGRICAFGEPGALAAHLVNWLEACRSVRLPADTPATARYQGGLTALEQWLAASGWGAANVVRLMETLAAHGAGMLAWAVKQVRDARGDPWEYAAHHLKAVGRLGEVDAEGCGRIAELQLWEAADYLLRQRPQRLKYLARLDPGWVRTQQYHGWRRLFTLPDEKLLSRLLEWCDAAAAGDVIREDVLAFADAWEVLADSEEYARFVAGHFWVLDTVWRGLRSRPGGGALIGSGFRFRAYLFPADLFLDLLMAAGEQGWPDLRRLAEILVSRPSLLESREDRDCHRLSLELAAGNLVRFEKLYEAKKTRPVWTHAAEALAGWRFLKRSVQARQLLSQYAEEQAARACVLRLLERVALAVQIQLQPRLRAALRTWERPAPATGLALPTFLPEDLKQTISELAFYHRLASGHEGVPEPLRKILDRPKAMRRELAVLLSKQALRTLPPQAEGRVRNLRKYLAGREALERWVTEEARAAAQAEAPRARLRALAGQVEEALRSRWEEVLGHQRIPPDDPGWDHALRLHCHAKANRRLLKALLRQVLEEGRGWPLDHPKNAVFEEEMRRRGVNVEEWKSPLQQPFQVNLGDWVAYAENDPLRIFEMGNLFGACLSAGGVNDFATVANAVEANKRVLFLRDQRGAIIGRKLIALTASPRGAAVLVGFRSYGSQQPGEAAFRSGSRASGWVKVVFDVFCLEIARKIGARLAGPDDGIEELSQSLPLFAKWYNHGPEPFDEWVIQPGAGISLVTAGGVRCRPGVPLRPERPEQRAAVARALLWLGANALPVLKEMDLEALGTEALEFVRRHTASPEVWRWLGRRM